MCLAAFFRRDVLKAALGAGQFFGQRPLRVGVEPQRARVEHPRLHQHRRVFPRGLEVEPFPHPPQLLDHVQIFRVEVPGPAQPTEVVEAARLDHRRVTHPVGDRIAVPGAFQLVIAGDAIEREEQDFVDAISDWSPE